MEPERIWYGRVPRPEVGHRFNPHKLLLDPHSCAHTGELTWNPALFGYRMETMDDLSFDERDSDTGMTADFPQRSGEEVGLFDVTGKAVGPKLPTLCAVRRGRPFLRSQPAFDFQQKAKDTLIGA